MPTESFDSIASTRLETTSRPKHQPPAWFAELAVLTRWFSLHWVPIALCSTLRLKRRVDATAAIDAVLFMLTALVGNCSLASADRALAPVRKAVPQLWDRQTMASRSATSRFLSALDEPALAATQTLFCPPSASSA